MANIYRIIKDPNEVMPFANIVSEHADGNKNELGFLPKQSYASNILAGKIWVASDNEGNYVGHIMFGGKPPYNVRVFQIFVVERFRKKGLASALVSELKAHAEQQGCFTLDAHIAEDLATSIKFYEKQGFYKNCDRRSKNTTGRKIVIYTCKLDNPSLFDDQPFSLLGLIKGHSQTGLVNKYVLDLNILFELIENRSQYDFIKGMLKAALSGEIKIQVTPEFEVELMRTKKVNDPMLEIASALPILKSVDRTKLIEIEEDIRKIIFPKRDQKRKQAGNDDSDLRHIAYCIHYGIPAFVTLENKILNAQQEIQSKYDLQICSPIDLGLNTDAFNYQEIDSIGQLIDTKSIDLDMHPSALKVKSFLSHCSDLDKEIYTVLSAYPSDNILVLNIAYLEGVPVALFLVEEKKGMNALIGYVLVLQDAVEELFPIIDHFLETFSRATQEHCSNEIMLFSSNISFLNDLCLKRGYILNESYLGKQNSYKKLISPKVISRANWHAFKESLEKLVAIELPSEIPTYKTDKVGSAYIDIREKNGYQRADLFQLETILSPSIFLLPERSGVIVAIKKGYSEGLISHPPDRLPFLIESEAFLRLEKAYFRSSKNCTGLFKIGMPVVFYEKKPGRGAIGLARITSSAIVSISEAIGQYKRNGVLSERELQAIASADNKIHVITFDNFQEFLNPVSFEALKEIGCGKASFVSPEKVKSSHLSQIIHKGYNLPMRDPLISIKPKYVSKIISRKKTIELRRKPLPCTENGKIWIYSTAPEQCIKATAKVARTHKGTPSEIWEKYGSRACISKEDFDSYFVGSEDAYAIELIDVKELSKEVKLSQIQKWLPDFRAPQFYRYLEHESDIYGKLNKFLFAA